MFYNVKWRRAVFGLSLRYQRRRILLPILSHSGKTVVSKTDVVNRLSENTWTTAMLSVNKIKCYYSSYIGWRFSYQVNILFLKTLKKITILSSEIEMSVCLSPISLSSPLPSSVHLKCRCLSYFTCSLNITQAVLVRTTNTLENTRWERDKRKKSFNFFRIARNEQRLL